METLNFLESSSLLLIKIGAIVLLSLYFIYSFIIVKQVNLMTQTLDVALKKQLKFFAVFHMLWAVVSLLYAIIM